MIEITFDSAIDGLKALVEEQGEDFIYPRAERDGSCVYVHEGKPDCIVGRFLAAQGVPLERLVKADTEGSGPGLAAGILLGRLSDEGTVYSGDGVKNLLDSIQYRQDRGEPWGAALAAVTEYYQS
jgi:hypothetical protein